MTRGMVVTWAVVFVGLVSLSLLLVDHVWRWNEIVALCLGAALFAAFVAASVGVHSSGTATTEPKGPDRVRPSVPRVFLYCVGGGVALFVVGSVFAVLLGGISVFTQSTYWWLLVVALGVGVLVGMFVCIPELFESNTLDDVARKRGRRVGRRRDLTLLAESDAAARQLWRTRLTTSARRRVLVHVPIIVAVSVSVTTTVASGLGGWFKTAVLVLTGLAVAAGVFTSIRGRWADPLVLVTRVVDGVDGITPAGETVTYNGSPGLSYLDHGAWLTLDLEVRAAASLRRDGTLVARPEWRGLQKVGVRRKVRRDVIRGQHCVLLCAGNGLALDVLGRFTASRRARGAAAG